jgi:hypothetical protein
VPYASVWQYTVVSTLSSPSHRAAEPLNSTEMIKVEFGQTRSGWLARSRGSEKHPSEGSRRGARARHSESLQTQLKLDRPGSESDSAAPGRSKIQNGALLKLLEPCRPSISSVGPSISVYVDIAIGTFRLGVDSDIWILAERRYRRMSRCADIGIF